MLAIITSHPIQYQAPLWRALARDGQVPFEVWFLTPHAVRPTFDPEFGQTFAWDMDLLEAYPHRFLELKPGWSLNRFNGIQLQRDWATEFRARGVTTIWLEGWRFRTLWMAVMAARRAGLQVWLRGENHDLAPTSLSRRFWKRLALSWLFRRVDHFLCIGNANRQFYLGYQVPETKLVSTPYCVDNEYFSRAAAEQHLQRAELRQRWNIAGNAYCVLFCGKLITKKRPLDLVAAARLIPETADRPLHLLFAGDGELAQEIRANLNSESMIRGTITGFLNQTEIPSVFAASDCLVLPSDYGETWGLVVNEALASGLPVIVSDRCGCAADIAAPLGSAHVFPCGNIAALAASIQQVAFSPPPPSTLAALSDAHSPMRTIESVSALWLNQRSI